MPNPFSNVLPTELPAATSSNAARAVQSLGSNGGDSTPATATCMIVDDEPLNVRMVQKYLKDAGYSDFMTTSDSREAMQMMHAQNPDVLLLDILMPHVDGFEILEAVRCDSRFQHLPVLILTAATDDETRERALNLGATDFLQKPIKATELVPRVRNALVLKSHFDQLANYSEQLEQMVKDRTAALERSRAEVIKILACAAEYRDQETGNHVIRVGEYAGIVAAQMNLPSDHVDLIRQAAVLHDVGKIGIPDAILLKPGRFDEAEREVMERHCEYGLRILQAATFTHGGKYDPLEVSVEFESPILQLAAKIAMSHHEKWDGSGYPVGLAGNSIPVEGRIVAVADVFDALTSRRPYKDPFPLEKCLDIIQEGSGKHFDPQVVEAFFRGLRDIVNISVKYAD